MRHLDLFSGIGGFALAAKWIGITTTQFVEVDPFCQKVLQKNFPGVPIHDDVTTFTAPRGVFDIATGGYPCQDNSLANPRGKGLDGDRSGLWFEMLRVIDECRPKMVVVENVPPSRNRRWDETVRRGLEELDYKTKPSPASALEAGSNHLRNRLFIVAYTDGVREQAMHYIDTGAKESLHYQVSPWGEESREFRRGASGRIFMLPRSWAPRVDDGIPSRMDRDRAHALGNAVVPQCALDALQRVIELSSQPEFTIPSQGLLELTQLPQLPGSGNDPSVEGPIHGISPSCGD